MGSQKNNITCKVLYDRTLLWLFLSLIGIGFVMVSSASIPIAERFRGDAFYFCKRDAFHILLSFIVGSFIICIPIYLWHNCSRIILIASISILLGVTIIGHSINGASRWITVGSFYVQPSELSKLSLLLYLDSYIVRKIEEVRSHLRGFLKPISVIGIFSLLLLIQPDLGTIILIFLITISTLFLAGTKLWQFIAIFNCGILTIIFLIVSEPYRLRRIIAFWNPWKDPFGNGYQITQSMMALGRGEIVGQGIGNSVQKLDYLPQTYNDFIFSIIGEELGYCGVVLVLCMEFFIVLRAMSIGNCSLRLNRNFSGFLSYSLAIWFAFQLFINAASSFGLLPTKGLTLPLISYGGSSLIIMSIVIALLLRIDYENRLEE